MEPTDLRPYLGHDCSVVVRCQACGREHERTGVLAAGPHGGDVSLAGIVYDVQDIVAVSPRTQAEVTVAGLSPSMARLLPYAGLAALLATWLHLVHR